MTAHIFTPAEANKIALQRLWAKGASKAEIVKAIYSKDNSYSYLRKRQLAAERVKQFKLAHRMGRAAAVAVAINKVLWAELHYREEQELRNGKST